jgi:acetolactate synthase-1/2/3 large subunit
MFAGSDRPWEPIARDAAVPEAGEGPLARTAAALRQARKPLMVLGSQAFIQAAEAPRIAEAVTKIGVPVYLSGMARGALGRDASLQMRHARRNALRESDFVLLAGVPCDFRLDYGRHVRRSATLVAANRSRVDARLNRKPTIEAIGDAGRFMVALAERAGVGAPREDWIGALAARDAEREREIDAQAQVSGENVNPVAFFRAMETAAGENAIFIADGGDFVATASYILRPRGPLAWLDPGAFGTLGVGAGFALGASVTKPSSEVWLVWGDGACGYGLAEFDTFVRHGIPVIAVVGNDTGWTQIAREQVKMLGDDVGTVLRRAAYQDVAKGFGAQGIEIRRDSEVAGGLAEARQIAASGKPVLVNVWLDKTEFREGSISM